MTVGKHCYRVGGRSSGRAGLADFLGDPKVKKLRHWKQADAGWLRDMDNECFPKDKSFFNDENYHWWTVDDGGICAYAGLRIEKKGGRKIAHLTRCGVLPGCRGLGFQRRLIHARLKWCRQKGIQVVRTYTSGPKHPGGPNPRSTANLKETGFRSRTSADGKWITFWLNLKE